MNIYVGNLPYSATEEDIREAFSAFGAVTSVSVIKDKVTGESRGFAFVEMPDAAEGQAAIDGMNGQRLKGRQLTVNQARPRSEGGERHEGGRSGGFGDRRGGERRGGDRGGDRGQRRNRDPW